MIRDWAKSSGFTATKSVKSSTWYRIQGLHRLSCFRSSFGFVQDASEVGCLSVGGWQKVERSKSPKIPGKSRKVEKLDKHRKVGKHRKVDPKSCKVEEHRKSKSRTGTEK